MTNGGGIRGGKVYPPGTALTARDVLTELPFDNRILTIEIAGADLRHALATNDFMARGGDGYTEFRDAKPLLSALDAPLVANAVIAHIKALGTVRTNADGRIVMK